MARLPILKFNVLTTKLENRPSEAVVRNTYLQARGNLPRQIIEGSSDKPNMRAQVKRDKTISFALQIRWVTWSGVAKVSCILCYRGVQLILAYSQARPAILVAAKGRGGMFLFLLFLHAVSFLFLCFSCPSLSLPLLSLFSLVLGDDTK